MTGYYQQVEAYYDGDADDFDRRYWQNIALQEMRQSFREEVLRHEFRDILEIGYGTGLDMAHFAQCFPEAKVFGIDISGAMQQAAGKRLDALGLDNATAKQGSVEDLAAAFPGQSFDLVYVFFGALNTVEDLDRAAMMLRGVLRPGGVLVLTFVNKWYIMGMIIELLKGRFKAAFSRLRKVWGGYSPSLFLPSRCYRPAQVRKAFGGFRELRRQGFSILLPAWYYRRLNRMPARLRGLLRRLDDLLNESCLWRFGEYTLFVFQLPDDRPQHISE